MTAEDEILYLGRWGDDGGGRDVVSREGRETVAEDEIRYLEGWGDGRGG